MHVRIKAGEDVQPEPEAHLESSEYILFADGSLHYAEFDAIDSRDPASGERFPPLRQVLDRAAVSEIWSVAQQAGFTDPANGQPPINFDLVEIKSDERAHLIDFRAGGRRWMFIRKSPGNESPAPGITRLVRTIAKYAWASDLPDEDIYVRPPRYDFGPDPYARYRR